MLKVTGITPATPMFIPEIGVDALKEVEQTVNALIKLCIKLHAEQPDVLFICSSKAPVYHHRFGMTDGSALVRVFESNKGDGQIVDMQFPVAEDILGDIVIEAHEQKIQVDRYTQEQKVTPIDDGALALLYYIMKLEWKPKVVILSTSDLPASKHEELGRVIGNHIKKSDQSFAVIGCGNMCLRDEKIYATMQESMLSDRFYDYLKEIDGMDAIESGQTLYYPLAMMKGVMDTAWGSVPVYHPLGTETYLDMGFSTGFFANS